MAWTQSRSKTSDARGTDGVCLVLAAPTRLLLQCVSPKMALFGPPKMSDLNQQSWAKRTLIRLLSPIAIL